MSTVRSAIVEAYSHLVRTEHTAFPAITDILRESGVARSTLYKYFDNRSAMLAEALRAPFVILADAARTGEDTAALVALFQHFGEERRAISELLATPYTKRLADALARQIISRISNLGRADATRVAHSQLIFLRLWVTGETNCAPDEMAKIFSASSFALTTAAITRQSVVKRVDQL